MKKILIIIGIFTLILFLIFFIFYKRNAKTQIAASPTSSSIISATIAPSVSVTSSVSPSNTQIINNYDLALPIADFKARITKKPFAIFVTPQSSPVQPEKYTGFHTGVDVEYADVTDDVPVYAISDGVVSYSGTISGYGGVLVLKQNINNREYLVLYGHLDPTRLVANSIDVKKGEQIGYLGKDKSTQTDGERKHLHFAILKGDTTDYLGYVQSEAELSSWYNPLDFY